MCNTSFFSSFIQFTGILPREKEEKQRGKSSNKAVKKKVNPFPNKPRFLCVYISNLLKTPWGKEKLLVTSNYSFTHSVFYQFGRILPGFHQIQNCRLQPLPVWERVKFVIWERIIEFKD